MSDAPDQPEKEKIEQGGFVVGDLVAIATPDGRFHYGQVSEIDENDNHFWICHHGCDENQVQFKIEFDALKTHARLGSKGVED